MSRIDELLQRKRFINNSENISNKSIKRKHNLLVNQNNDNLLQSTNDSVISDAPLHRLLPYNCHYYANKIRVIKEHNLKVNDGKYTEEENMILKRNWIKFCDEFDIKEDVKNRIIGYFVRSSLNSKQDKKKIRNIKREEKFWLRMANGLPHRTLYSIKVRCRVYLSSLKRMRNFSDNDRQMITKLKSIWGNKWTKIGEKLNCDPRDIENYFSKNFSKEGLPFNTGRWTANEDKRLIKTLKKYLETNDLSDKIFMKNISWTKVRDMGKINRSYKECALHWNYALRWKVANFDRMENWRKRDSAKLIYVLFKCNYMNECDIDWDYIKEKFANITSFNNLCKNWQIIKTIVPEFHIKTYKQIITFLYDNYLPYIVKTDEDLKVLEEFMI